MRHALGLAPPGDAEIGEILGKKWGLQSQLVEAMSYHHDPYLATDENHLLVHTVYVADIFTKMQCIGDSGNSYITKIRDEVLEELKLTEESLDELAGFLAEGVERASVFLQAAG